jgi:hypothetical protein
MNCTVDAEHGGVVGELGADAERADDQPGSAGAGDGEAERLRAA